MASIKKRPDGKWRARYRDDAGREHARHFDRKVDAQRWLDEVAASQLTGQYVDPKAGRITLRTYAEQWRAAQPHRASTAELVERHLRRYVYPALGDRPLASLRPSHLQAFATQLTKELQPATVRVVMSRLQVILTAAVRDRLIAVSPYDRIALPDRPKRDVVPLTPDQVWALAIALPPRYQAMAPVTAGLGLRHAELTGLTVDRVQFLRRQVVVDQQLTSVTGRKPFLAPPKTAQSRRIVPLPKSVAEVLTEHIRYFPPGEDGLIFTTARGLPIHRATLSTIWKQAVAAAGLPVGTRLHDLRHTYASMLIEGGASVAVVSERLGHAHPTITLGVYTHLFPKSEERTRDIIDGLLAPSVPAADSLRTDDV